MNYRQAAVVLREISPARIFARPTAEDLWLGPTRESVLSHLTATAPVRVLMGPQSSGRSCLLHHVARRTRDSCITLRLKGPQPDANKVLKGLLGSAGLNTEGIRGDGLRRLFGVYLAEQQSRGQTVVFEVDDADTFGPDAWSEIERLTAGHDSGAGPRLLLSLIHLEDASSPAAACVRRLRSPVLGVVDWLEPVEVASYIEWRLGRFGLDSLMTPSALRLIARCSLGRFQPIDHICQMALLLLRNRGGDQINVNLVREAMQLLKLRQQTSGRQASKPAPARLIVSHEGQVVRQVQLTERFLIGRSPLNDLCLDNAYLSRHHVAVLHRDSGYFISDLNSVNGISLNGQPVHYAQISDGDVFSAGPFRMKLRTEDALGDQRPDELSAAELADTVMMPTPSPDAAHLKIVK